MSETYTNNVGRSDYRLPTVSANDNGKILKVVEGEWKKAEGGGSGGGGDVMTVIISDGASSVSESIEDILLALSSGKSVIAVYDDSYTCLLSYDNNISGVSGVALESFDSGTAGCYVISGYNDGTSDVWDVGEYSYSSGGGGGTIYLEQNLSGEIGASYNDILAYINGGKSIFYSFQGEYSTIILPLIGYNYDSTPGEERYLVFFGGVDPDASDISIVSATASSATDTLVVS